ncbi:MAG: ATP-grasp domain-containing protein [Candidatus Riflebacteria bacterium]|nr:ATP-grasp domain-containing protein [Candidatus Riflebacteria bacterium]
MGETDQPPQRILVIHNTPAETPIKGESVDSFSECEVVATAREVALALRERGYTQVFELGVTRDLTAFLEALREIGPDVVFNLCEGIDGDEHHEPLITHLMEFLGVPFTGGDTRALADSNNKYRAKQILAAEGVPTPRSVLVRDLIDLGRFDIKFPVIVKPVQENASLGITQESVAYAPADLVGPVTQVLEKYRQPALVEQYIEGREFNVAILGGRKPWVLPISEVDYSSLPEGLPRILFYEAKWIEDSPLFQKTPIVCPARLTPRLADEIKKIALEAYVALGCSGYARVDMRVSRRGKPYVIEVNCNPSLAPEAGLARSARVAGLTYPMLVETIVRLAVDVCSPTSHAVATASVREEGIL